MSRCVVRTGLVALVLAFSGVAHADVMVRIDKNTQRMSVLVDGEPRHSWPVSTGRAGFGTPNGSFRPQRLARHWFSRKYYSSPMPHAIFFHEGFAIHGTTELSRLGGPASHGCVRLHPGNAATLFALVQKHGSAATRIVVTGANPSPGLVASRAERRRLRLPTRSFGELREFRERRAARFYSRGAPAYLDVSSGVPIYYVPVPMRLYPAYSVY